MSTYPTLGPLAPSNPQLVAEGWDLATYGGLVVPGYCRVRGSIKVKFDPKKKGGAHGGHTTFHGMEGQPFDLELAVCGDQDLADADAFCQRVLPSSKSTNKSKVAVGGIGGATAIGQQATAGAIAGAYGTPLVLDHPSIRQFAPVFAVVIGATSWEPKPEWGVLGRRMTIQMLHWIPPVTGATVTPKRGGVAANANASFQTALRLENTLFHRDQVATNLPPSQRSDAGLAPAFSKQ